MIGYEMQQRGVLLDFTDTQTKNKRKAKKV
jgi:hypothetical protein